MVVFTPPCPEKLRAPKTHFQERLGFDTAFETIAKALLCWNRRNIFFRSSSEMFVHRHWERFEKHSLPIIVPKRESTRRHEASQTAEQTQIDRQQIDRQKGSVGVGVACGVWCGVTYLGAVVGAVSGKHGVDGLVARCYY